MAVLGDAVNVNFPEVEKMSHQNLSGLLHLSIDFDSVRRALRLA